MAVHVKCIKKYCYYITDFKEGIPFCKNWGFLNFPCGTSQIGNSLFKTSVKPIEYYGPDGLLKLHALPLIASIFLFIQN